MSQVPKISVGPAKRPRNGFDCSESHIYSQPAGMLLPVWSKWLQPNDHVNIDVTTIISVKNSWYKIRMLIIRLRNKSTDCAKLV